MGVAPAPTEIIKSIEFEGNEKFKDHVLRERLGFKLGDRLDPFLAEGGRLTIIEVYRKIGFVSVAVTLDRERMARGNLLYTIDEGPRVQIDQITFIGNEAMSSGTLKKVIKKVRRQKEHILTFIKHEGAPSHNNYGEYIIKKGVVKRKMSGGSMSAEGVRAYASIQSVAMTCQLRGISFHRFLKASLIL